MSARKKPALPETFPMNEDVPNPFGYALMGILQVRMLEAKHLFPSVQLKAIHVLESTDEMAHTQFQFVDLNRVGEQRAYVTMSEYYKQNEPGAWRFYDLWLHTGSKTEELFVEAVEDELIQAANVIWAHLMPEVQK